jgi:AraC-like DNA-binding protein
MPTIAMANAYQFTAKQRTRFQRVESVMLLWCKAGAGQVTANGQAYVLHPGQFLLLPWNHAIAYYPDATSPFLVAGVHLIPDYPPGLPPPSGVTHVIQEREGGATSPCGAGSPPLCTSVIPGAFTRFRALEHCAEYIVAWAQRGRRPAWMARHLAEVLVEELHLVIGASDHAFPPQLHTLLSYLHDHLAERISLPELATHIGCNPSTVTRLFARYLQRTPMQWLLDARMDRAAHLLVTTALPVGEIGRQVGIDDPYYFSKRFRQYYGVAPTVYRRQSSLLVR